MTNPDPLELRPLAKTAMTVTAVGLGGAGLGGIFGPVGDADGVAAVEQALELGINYLDTSPKYGEAERRMGMALRGVPRNSFLISSKVGTHPLRPGDYSAEAARWTVARSLQVLGVDHLDLCHIHEPEPEQLTTALAPGGAMEALVALKAEGVIRAIGIGVQDHALHRQAVDTGQLDVCMMVNDYTLLRQDVDDVFALAESKGLGLVNGAALAMGLLSGRDPTPSGPRAGSHPATRWRPPSGCTTGAASRPSRSLRWPSNLACASNGSTARSSVRRRPQRSAAAGRRCTWRYRRPSGTGCPPCWTTSASIPAVDRPRTTRRGTCNRSLTR